MAYPNTVNRISKKRYRDESTLDWILRKVHQLIPIVSLTMRLINVETKRAHTQLSSTTVTQAGSILLMTGVAQGQTDQTRIGDSVLGKYLTLSGRVDYTAANSLVRIMAVVDLNDPAGSAPTIAQILESGYSGNVHAIKNYDNAGRFRVLWDKLVYVDADDSVRAFKWYKRMDWHTHYYSTDADHVCESNVYLLWYGSASTNQPAIRGEIIYAFIDN